MQRLVTLGGERDGEGRRDEPDQGPEPMRRFGYDRYVAQDPGSWASRRNPRAGQGATGCELSGSPRSLLVQLPTRSEGKHHVPSHC